LPASLLNGRHSAAKEANIDTILERFGCGEDVDGGSSDFIERPKFVFFYFFFQIMYYVWYHSYTLPLSCSPNVCMKCPFKCLKSAPSLALPIFS
jgi:hypothetical protein